MPELVNIGSLCIDHVYAVPAIVRPGETLLGQTPARYAGGKGLNQSLAAVRAGVPVAHFGCVGTDGIWLKELLAAAGVDVDGTVVRPEAVTGHAVIQVTETGENAIVIVGGANRQLGGLDVERALVRASRDGNWLLLQNEVNDIIEILVAAQRLGVRIAFNVAPVDAQVHSYPLEHVTLLLLNELEAQTLAGETTPARALARLARSNPAQHVIVTRGREGLLYGRGGERIELPAFDVAAVDETGAGDAFIGYLMAGWLAGRPLREALRRASAAGALAVTVAGAATAIPTAADVERFLALPA
jgi:ribokinase